jgi:hypothetical protein
LLAYPDKENVPDKIVSQCFHHLFTLKVPAGGGGGGHCTGVSNLKMFFSDADGQQHFLL